MIRKKIAKLMLGTLTATMLLSAPVLAEEAVYDEERVEIKEENTREEAFMWFYRTYEGRRQKRLWSLTYQYWVTDWIDIGPA
jgi:hypothetical protein